MQNRIGVVMLLMSVSATGYSSSGENQACQVGNIEDFYNRVVKHGPNSKEALKSKEVNAAGIELAKQRPNPELDMEYIKGDEFGLETSTYSLSAQHVYEYGNKRDKRINKAKSFQYLKDSQIDMSLRESNLGSTRGYQRVGQLNILIDSVKEAISTFKSVIKKLASRPRLNPQETVSLSTLRLATDFYRASLNDLENQKTIVSGHVSFHANCEGMKAKYKPLKFTSTSPMKELKSSGLLKIEDLKVELAQSQLDVQKSLGYSNISVGPSVEYRGVGNDSFVSGGVAVTFDLPLFQTNDGGKLKALRQVAKQKVESKNQKKLIQIQRQRLISKYDRSVKLLNRMPSLKTLERKHRKVEKLFTRGIVSISMTIEAHRQQVSFLTSRFETENDALDTLIQISLIDGDTSHFESVINANKE